MRILARFALSIGAAALLAGCGGSQSAIGAPGAPQASGLAARNDNAHYRVVYTFGAPPDGEAPVGSLIEVGGTLYGTTALGGASDRCFHGSSPDGGTVFSVTPTGTEKVLHSFTGRGTDGCTPDGALIDVGGTLYGTTRTGGTYGCGSQSCGTIFRITTAGKEKVLYEFAGSPDGVFPNGPLIDINGMLYGTTSAGGRRGCGHHLHYDYTCGTVFAVSVSGLEKVLYEFHRGPHGYSPHAGLVAMRLALYGTTYYGGDYGCNGGKGCGSVFRLTRDGKEKTLHTFGNGTDGQLPSAGLINIKGTLYGTTQGGGPHYCNNQYAFSCGTVFSITPAGVERVLHSFNDADGATPQTSLIDVKGTLYGTTRNGGAYGYGTVFSITTTGKEKVLHSFSGGSDGLAPEGGLLDVKGTLYGTTSGGFGEDGYGTVFALTP